MSVFGLKASRHFPKPHEGPCLIYQGVAGRGQDGGKNTAAGFQVVLLSFMSGLLAFFVPSNFPFRCRSGIEHLFQSPEHWKNVDNPRGVLFHVPDVFCRRALLHKREPLPKTEIPALLESGKLVVDRWHVFKTFRLIQGIRLFPKKILFGGIFFFRVNR